MTTVAFSVLRHVRDLENADLDALLDIRLFKNEHWCAGHIDYFFKPGQQNLAVWQCRDCGASETHGTSGFLIGDQGHHPRLVPAYTQSMATIWPVLAKVAEYGKAFETCFLLHVASTRPGRPLTSTVLFWLEPRAAAIAALKTFGIVDAYGYLHDTQ